jgi:hypothetical protein
MKFFYTFLFLISYIFLFGQKNDSTAKVIMLNGDKYIGKILVFKANEVVILEVAKDSSIALAWEDIRKIEYEINGKFVTPKKQMPLIIKEKGPYFHYVSSWGYGRTYRGFPLFNIEADFIWGYKFNRYLSLGAGMGHHYYPETAFVGPLFAELKANALHKRMIPSFFIRAGYAALSKPTVIHDVFKAKQYMSFGLGYQENTARKFAWTYSLGLMKQWTYIKMTRTDISTNPFTGQSTTFSYEIDGNVVLNRIVWSWGILF